MATTSETAIVWAIMFMGVSTMATLMNFVGPPGTTFFSGGAGLSDSVLLSNVDTNTLISTFQLPNEITDDASPSTSFAFIGQGLAVGGFVFQTLLSINFAWAAIITDAVFSFGIPVEMAIAITLIFIGPFVILQMIGLLEISRRIKVLIPFI